LIVFQNNILKLCFKFKWCDK